MTPIPKRMRADEWLVEKGLVDSRAQAKLLILSGRVYLPHARIEKASMLLEPSAQVTITQPPKYVSRGGEKLEGFFKAYPWPLCGKYGLDVGASTGGFTDYLLQNGIEHVTCLDVGHSQLHDKLRKNGKVVNLEKINAKTLDAVTLPYATYDVIVMDLSFISLKKILPLAWMRLAPNGRLMALIKPQFEAEKAEVNKGKGIIRDPMIHDRILKGMRVFCDTHFFDGQCVGCIPSPITGGDGNQEYMIGYDKEIVE